MESTFLQTIFFAVCGVVSSTVVYLVKWAFSQDRRLESHDGRIAGIEKRLDFMETKLEAMNAKVLTELDDVKKALYKMQGFLQALNQSLSSKDE